MFSIFKRKKNTIDLKRVVEEQLRKNMRVIESLRDYDAGKKDISTRTAEDRLHGIRTTLR